jgi:hypothetical protein
MEIKINRHSSFAKLELFHKRQRHHFRRNFARSLAQRQFFPGVSGLMPAWRRLNSGNNFFKAATSSVWVGHSDGFDLLNFAKAQARATCSRVGG